MPLSLKFNFHGVVDFKSRLAKDYASSDGTSLISYGNIYSLGDHRMILSRSQADILSEYKKVSYETAAVLL